MSLFVTGRFVATPGAIGAMSQYNVSAFTLLCRHTSGDWGEVDKGDAEENELSVKEGYRILSSYTIGPGVKVWIITEADRSSTTILLPEEY